MKLNKTRKSNPLRTPRTRRPPNVKRIPTKLLTYIVENKGLNASHSKDYGAILDELQNELYARQTARDQREQR